MATTETRFHIEKSISIGHIITTISIVFSVIWWASTVETRLAIYATKLNEHEAMQNRQDADVKTLRDEINTKLDKLGDKMDRIIESRK